MLRPVGAATHLQQAAPAMAEAILAFGSRCHRQEMLERDRAFALIGRRNHAIGKEIEHWLKHAFDVAAIDGNADQRRRHALPDAAVVVVFYHCRRLFGDLPLVPEVRGPTPLDPGLHASSLHRRYRAYVPHGGLAAAGDRRCTPGLRRLHDVAPRPSRLAAGAFRQAPSAVGVDRAAAPPC